MFGNKVLTKAPGYGVTRFPEARIEHFQKNFASIARALSDVGWVVEPGEIFNSGYEGFHFKVNGEKVLIIEQPGVIGLEDHRTGYMSVRLGGKETIVIKHNDRRFGDVWLNEQELEQGYTLITELIEEYFEQQLGEIE